VAAGPAHASDPFALVGQRLGGRFQIERFVAEGGFGVVYRARQVALDRPVAIKILKAAPDLRHETFEAEAKTVARLKHPNIVEVYDFGVSKGPSGLVLHWMALEWLEGRTLAALLAEERTRGGPRRDPAAAMELLRPVLQAVAFAHQQGVAHRDLKPANIFVTGQPGESSLKVLDFGVAQLLAPDRKDGGETTQRGPAGFSPDYAAPEQVSYGRTGPWTDVHALGLMLTELLVGAAPYDASDPEARFAQVIAERRPTPAARGLDVGAWEPVLQKALARRPAERHPNAGDLLAALKQENAPGDPRFRRRSLWLALAAAAVALAFVGWRMLPLSSAPEASDRIKVAVLPFENLTGDLQQEYFSDGLTDGVIGALGRFLPQRLAVTTRTSVLRYKKTNKTAKEIGRELGVQHLLTSSLRRQDDKLHVESHLVRVSDETEIWASSYDRPVADVLALQAEIAHDVAQTIRLKFGGQATPALAGKRPVKPAAYEAYLRGRYLSVRGASGEVQRLRIAAFEESIKLDPTFAPSFAGLATALESLQSTVKPGDVEQRWRWAALRALELDDRLPEAHTAMAVLLLRYDFNWVNAERHFRRALELDANNPDALNEYAMLCLTVGRFDEAIALRTRTMEIDPLVGVGWRLGAAYYHARQYDRAITQLQSTIAAEPPAIPAIGHLARAYVAKGMLTEAARESERVLQLSDTPVTLGNSGFVLARAGHEKRARAVLDRLLAMSKSRYVQPIFEARIYAGFVQPDQAFAALERAFEERSPDLTFLRVDPVWDTIRNDPRFADLVRRVGIPTASGEVR
jgi:serine/threonine protein kinase/tetratricopeptide (TPR) repeat protein